MQINNKQQTTAQPKLTSYLLKMTTPNNDTMEFPDTESLLRLLLIEKNFSPELRGAINDKAKNLLKDLTVDVVDFFYDELDEVKHSEDDIRTLVQCVPTALSDEEEYGFIPILAAIYRNVRCIVATTYSFLPVLAEEGIKHNVGGEGMRGGLLCIDVVGKNVLHSLSCCGRLEDSRCLDAIKRLREMGLFSKGDIKEYNLLWDSCRCGCPKRFNYFVDWDPSLLKESVAFGQEKALLHMDPNFAGRYKFQLALGASLRHYPHELGLLLLKNPNGGTPFQRARNVIGKKEAWKLIQKCLDESNVSQILEKNSETNMYPFMFAAVGDTSELDLVYYLLHRNPLSVCSDNCSSNTTCDIDVVISQKRKR
jgi:hypothetical protein